MREHSDVNITEAAIAAVRETPDPRLHRVIESLIRHLHAFVRDVEMTEAEWVAAVGFLADAGRMCHERRNEFILLSDVLGVSTLVDALNNRLPAGATQTTVLGPFHDERSPTLPYGARIGRPEDGIPCVVSGRVLDLEGRPIAGAELDVWQANDEGFYDSVDPSQPEINLRAKFVTGTDGAYRFVGVKPEGYQVPIDGPGGRLLAATARKEWRPAHIHLKVSAQAKHTIVTHLFADGDPHLDADPVFGTKEALIVPFRPVETAGEAASLGVELPCYRVDFDVVLAPAAASAVGAAQAA